MAEHARPAPTWEQGDAYDAFMGRWSRPVAAEVVAWLAVPPGRRWLDVGCGTGALTASVLADAQPVAVAGVDTSAGFVAYAEERVRNPRATFQVADALDLPFASGAFDAAVSGLVLNHTPDPAGIVREMARVTAEGGTVAAYVWDYDSGMEQLTIFWEVATSLDPAAAEHDQRGRYPVCRPEALHDLCVGAGLREVAVSEIVVSRVYRDFDDYWLPFFGGQGSAPGYVRTLSEEQVARVREALRARLPVEGDGSIRLHARAWVVRGTR